MNKLSDKDFKNKVISHIISELNKNALELELQN